MMKSCAIILKLTLPVETNVAMRMSCANNDSTDGVHGEMWCFSAAAPHFNLHKMEIHNDLNIEAGAVPQLVTQAWASNVSKVAKVSSARRDPI